jgi:hypothetical protein
MHLKDALALLLAEELSKRPAQAALFTEGSHNKHSMIVVYK